MNTTSPRPSPFADLAEVRRRHPAAMRTNWRGRAIAIGVIAAGLALLVFGFIQLEF